MLVPLAPRGLLLLVLLACFAIVPSTQADVYVLTKQYILEPLPSLQADFGPPISAEGIDGLLKAADPLDACSPFTFTDTKQPWVALISREQRHKSLDCTFDLKVRHAEQAGAKAAIVYDDVYESLIIMSKPQDHPDPSIPSVFVSEKAGSLLLRLLQLDEVRVRITPVSAVAWMSMVMSAFLGLLAMTIVFSSFYVMRTWSYWLTHGHHPRQPGQAGAAGGQGGRQAQQNQGLSPEVLRSFPVIVHESKVSPPSSPRPAAGTDAGAAEHSGLQLDKGNSCNSSDCEVPLPPGVHAGETKRLCTICLEHYEEGDKVRILPCYHRFHTQCIDAWLSNRSACPVCKHDASQPLQRVLHVPPGAEQQQQQEAGGTGMESGQAAPQRRWWSSWLGLGGTGRLSWLRRGRGAPEQPEQPEQDPLLATGRSHHHPNRSDIEAGGVPPHAAVGPVPPADPAGTAPAASQTFTLPSLSQQSQQQLLQLQGEAEQQLRLLREQQAQALRQWEELQRQRPQEPEGMEAQQQQQQQPHPGAAGGTAGVGGSEVEVASAAQEALVQESVAATRAAAAASGLAEVLTPEAAAMMEAVAVRQVRGAAGSSDALLPPPQ